MKHFYTTTDYSVAQIHKILKLAAQLKTGKVKKNLSGKILAMLFFNPSLRTRVSFIAGMQKLGGLAADLPIKDGAYAFEFQDGIVMDKNTIEHVKEGARVLSRCADALAIRASELVTAGDKSVAIGSWEDLKKDTVIKSFMQYSSVPVVNMESNVYHPCQGMADAMTIAEKLQNPRKKKYVLTWVPHPKALPMATPNSQMLSACELGMEVVIVYPAGWGLDPNIIKLAQKRAKETGGSFVVTHNQLSALKNAKVVTAKSWGALQCYGNWNKEKILREKYADWIIDQDKMQLTDNGYFLHCLPVRRNVEATDEVLDSPNSLIYDEAENRMWVQMAILLHLLQK